MTDAVLNRKILLGLELVARGDDMWRNSPQAKPLPEIVSLPLRGGGALDESFRTGGILSEVHTRQL